MHAIYDEKFTKLLKKTKHFVDVFYVVKLSLTNDDK